MTRTELAQMLYDTAARYVPVDQFGDPARLQKYLGIFANAQAIAVLNDYTLTERADEHAPKPGDLCRLLGDYKVEHHACDEHPDGTVTDVRTGKVVSR